MTSNTLPGRIPAASAGEVKSWMLPPVDDAGKVLSSAQKEARERREKMLKQGKETIENVEVAALSKTGMTAKDMQEIFDTAEKDGFNQGHEAGLQKGQVEGYEAGRQQGLLEMRSQLAIEKQRLHLLMEGLLNPLTAQDDDVENMLLDVICSLTQSVVQRDLLLDPEHILALVKTAVDALPIGSKNIRICLHPDDVALLDTYAREQQLEWKFFADEHLQLGGCRVETPESRVDFSVSLRLKTVLEQFLTGQLAAGGEEPNEPIL